MTGWIAVDLDGTLAHYDHAAFDPFTVGDPIMPMVNRIRTWITEGIEVRVFTARVDGGEVAAEMGTERADVVEFYRDVARIRTVIEDWTERHVGTRLTVTNKKDYGMVELWDDRAVRVVLNTGERCCAALAASEQRIAELEAENAKLRAHPPHPTLQRDLTEEEYSTGQLVEFLREAAGRDGIGAWRAKEFAQAADRLKEYEDAYLAVCPYEAEKAELEAALGRVPSVTDLEILVDAVADGGHKADRVEQLGAAERVRAALADPMGSQPGTETT